MPNGRVVTGVKVVKTCVAVIVVTAVSEGVSVCYAIGRSVRGYIAVTKGIVVVAYNLVAVSVVNSKNISEQVL